jgi:hypothetical protein
MTAETWREVELEIEAYRSNDGYLRSPHHQPESREVATIGGYNQASDLSLYISRYCNPDAAVLEPDQRFPCVEVHQTNGE